MPQSNGQKTIIYFYFRQFFRGRKIHEMSIPSLNIIGAGRVGQTLGKLFHNQQCFEIAGIFNKNFNSARKAVDFIGAGKAYIAIEDLPLSDATMITTPDGEIESIAFLLKDKTSLKPHSIIFHCSGSAPSEVLSPLKTHGIQIASVHPIMTFANPAVSFGHFDGVHCAFEGDVGAFALLERAFTQIGGLVFKIATEKKSIYHAATTVACNCLVALMDIAAELFVEAGLSREKALAAMQPIVKKTINNIFSLDAVHALTGPIARGDIKTIRAHVDSLEDTYAASVYKILGKKLIELSTKKKAATEQQLLEIERILFPHI
jgi:predicted short-subunit dehydrogenase-like oxidoreductase (DUF2520 family)